MDKHCLFRATSNFYSILITFPLVYHFSYIVLILFILSGFQLNCILIAKNKDSIIVSETVSASEILSDSATTMGNLKSFHFKSTGSITAADNLLLTEIEGEIIKPDYMNLQINGSYSSGLVFKTKLVSHNGKHLILNPLNKKWEAVSGNLNPTGFFTPHKGISKIMSEVYDIQFSSTDNSDKYYQLNGRLNSDSLHYLLGQIPQQPHIKVILSIDKANKFLYRAELNGKFTASNVNNDLFIDITKHNKPTKIEIPITE